MKKFIYLWGALILSLSILTTSKVVLAEVGASEEATSEKVLKMSSVEPQPLPNISFSKVPAPPVLKYPKALDVLKVESVTLKWAPSEGADQYHLQVASDVNFKWLIQDEPFVTSSEAPLTLSKGKRYYWRVAAVKSENKASHRKSAFSFSSFEVAP